MSGPAAPPAGWHRCPVTLPGGAQCGASIPRRQLMDPPHWRMADAQLRRAVYAAWGGGRYPLGLAEHGRACRAAVEDVEEKLLAAASQPAPGRR